MKACNKIARTKRFGPSEQMLVVLHLVIT